MLVIGILLILFGSLTTISLMVPDIKEELLADPDISEGHIFFALVFNLILIVAGIGLIHNYNIW